MLNEGDKYDDPVFVNAEILSHFKKKKETDYFWLLRHVYFQCHKCKIRTSLWIANILKTDLRSLKNEL